MRIAKTADYRIYFDDVRVDPYVVSWNTVLGLNAGDANASITLFKSKELESWKAYLTQVRVFAKNVFSGKYTMVFEGEITDRSWEDRRLDSGKITYNVQGFFHWLDTPIALNVTTDDSLANVRKFELSAAGIDIDATMNDSVLQTLANTAMADKTLKEIINYLFLHIIFFYTVHTFGHILSLLTVNLRLFQ